MTGTLMLLLPLLGAPSAVVVPPSAAPTLEVTVTGERALAKDKTADTTAVSGETLRKSPRATVFEALSQQAGDVYVSARGSGIHGVANGASGAIHIRGLGGSPNTQVLVVEDGVPDYQGIFGHPLPDEYFPFLIDQALVLKGGDSVLYGTNALAGAIILRSRWRQEEGFEVESDTGFGSYATLQQTVGLLGRWGDVDVVGAVHAKKTDGHREGAGGGDLVGQSAVRYRISPAFDVTVSDTTMHVTGADPGPVSHPTPGHWFDVWRQKLSLRAAYGEGPIRLSVTPYVNVGVHRLHDGFYSRDYTAGALAETTYRFAESAELLVGADAEGMDGRVENRLSREITPVQGNASVALYHQITVRPAPPVTVVFGARDIASRRYGALALYKAGLRCRIVDGLYVHTRAVENYRQPTLRELYLPYPTANPDLKPERALNWDFGAGYSSEHLDLSATGYRTSAQNLIKYFGAWPGAEVVNIDRIVVWGVEGRAALSRIGPFGASVTGDFQDVGRYTRQNPDAKVNFALDIGQAIGPGFVGASLSGEWVHGLYMADYGRQPIDDVFVVDAALRYRYTSAERGITLEPHVDLRNLLDHRYAYIADYTMPGFNVLAGLDMKM